MRRCDRRLGKASACFPKAKDLPSHGDFSSVPARIEEGAPPSTWDRHVLDATLFTEALMGMTFQSAVTLALLGVCASFWLTACSSENDRESTDPTPFTSKLDGADTLELFSLRPKRAPEGKPGFNRYEIVGSTLLKDDSIRKQVTLAIQQAAVDPDGMAKGCEFIPHHGLRATKDGKATDFLICFTCEEVKVYEEGKLVILFWIEKDAEPLLDATLEAAGVAVDKGR
jgi:hypothetical protein